MTSNQPSTQFMEIASGDIDCRVSAQGGAIVDACYRDTPFLRPYAGTASNELDILDAGSFPLLPFGGRVENNTFVFDGNVYSLKPNTGFDRHYLHGDAWLAQWEVQSVKPESVHLSLCQSPANGSPYHYAAEQRISVHANSLHIQLAVCNKAGISLPYGLGFHPFFPLTDNTTLCARAGAFWSEKHDYLPGELGTVPPEFDFKRSAALPARWINNGFEQWNGTAEITWHERNLQVSIATKPTLGYYQLYRPAPNAAAEHGNRFFCFEPMSHCCNAHNLTGNHGLVRLAKGESYAISVTLKPSAIE